MISTITETEKHYILSHKTVSNYHDLFWWVPNKVIKYMNVSLMVVEEDHCASLKYVCAYSVYYSVSLHSNKVYWVWGIRGKRMVMVNEINKFNLLIV